MSASKTSLLKPSVDTYFHIDFEWWKQHDSNWKVYLQSCLCEEHRESFENLDEDVVFDRVDPVTAEVQPVDGLQHVLMAHCAKQPDFITPQTSLVNAVFRIFLSNANTPLTPTELAELTNRPAVTILRTLAGPRVYKGIRPCIIC